MALSRKELKGIVTEVIEDSTDALVADEVEDLSEAIADRLVREDLDVYDEDEERVSIAEEA